MFFIFLVAINCSMMLVMTHSIPACQECVPFLDFLFRPRSFTPCPKFIVLKQALGLHLDVRVFDLFQQCAYLFLHRAMDSTLWQPPLWARPHSLPRAPDQPPPVWFETSQTTPNSQPHALHSLSSLSSYPYQPLFVSLISEGSRPRESLALR